MNPNVPEHIIRRVPPAVLVSSPDFTKVYPGGSLTCLTFQWAGENQWAGSKPKSLSCCFILFTCSSWRSSFSAATHSRCARMREEKEDRNTLIAMETSPASSYGSISGSPANAPVRDKNVFSDGVTRVDFVLVWEEPHCSNEDSSAADPTHVQWREEFLRRLEGVGLLQEQMEVPQMKKRVRFVLLSAPWDVLCFYAEEISLRVPLQVVSSSEENWSQKILSRLSLPNPLVQDVPNPPPDFYTCQFRTNKLQRFLGSDNQETFFKTTQRHQVAGRIASLSGSVLNLLLILLLSRVYTSLAHLLTRWEMHRTQSKYEDMFILKVFVFQFVNFYSSPVYIAFFKGRFVGYPGNYKSLFGVRNEDCGAGGCLMELAQEMLVIMVGKQLINNVQEFISP